MILNVTYTVQFHTKIEIDDTLQGEDRSDAIADAICDIEIPANGSQPTSSAYVDDTFEVVWVTDKEGKEVPF